MRSVAREKNELVRLRALVGQVGMLAKAETEDALSIGFIELAGLVLKADRTTFFRRDPEGVLVSIAAIGDPGPIRLAPGEGIAGHVARTGEAYRTTDAQADPHFQGSVDGRTGYVTRTALAVPVMATGALAGILEFLNLKGPVGPRSLQLGMEVAALAGVLLERMRFQRSVEASNQALRDLDRLRSEMITNISHELRTPLVSLSVALDLLEDSLVGNLPARDAELLQVARRNYRRLERQVRDVLYLSRIERERMSMAVSSLCPVRVAEEVLEQFRVTFRDKNFHIVLEMGQDVPEIRADPGQVDQVLTNLLMNAGKFTPAGGTVGVQVRRDGAGVRICVWDTGPGVPERDRERVFERFFRIQQQPQVQGVGIGLAIVKGIVEQHGGRVWVEGSEKRGARFNVYLPVSPTPGILAD